MLASCTKKNNNDISLNKSSTTPTNVSTQDTSNKYKGEIIQGKAKIKDIKVENGEVTLRIENLTSDNVLVSAYLEYVFLKDGKELSRFPLDAESINVSSNNSHEIAFKPQKYSQNGGVIKIKELIFKDHKDNYKR